MVDINKLDWPKTPVNLFSMPRLYIVDVIEEYRGGKKHTKTVVKPNPNLTTVESLYFNRSQKG